MTNNKNIKLLNIIEKIKIIIDLISLIKTNYFFIVFNLICNLF